LQRGAFPTSRFIFAGIIQGNQDMALLDKVSSGLTRVIPRLQSDRDLARFTRENVQPIAPDVPDETTNKPLSVLDPPAIDFRLESQLALLASFKSKVHQDLFRELREDPVINRFGFGSEGVSNTYCNTPDAEIYAAMIMDRKPPRVVEVGSGFSTLIARKAVSSGSTDTKIVVYDRVSADRRQACGRRTQPDAGRAERSGAEQVVFPGSMQLPGMTALDFGRPC